MGVAGMQFWETTSHKIIMFNIPLVLLDQCIAFLLAVFNTITSIITLPILWKGGILVHTCGYYLEVIGQCDSVYLKI